MENWLLSYKWTGWVWEIIGWSPLKRHEKHKLILEESMEYTHTSKEKLEDHNT
jgi:hypothetical protein